MNGNKKKIPKKKIWYVLLINEIEYHTNYAIKYDNL